MAKGSSIDDLELYDIFSRDGAGVYIKSPSGCITWDSGEISGLVKGMSVRKIPISYVALIKAITHKQAVERFNNLCAKDFYCEEGSCKNQCPFCSRV